ncbi:hypothetical protein [Modestobacter italicus]|uniref:hypothetical protein n=1 Tax=Modestobacter italicus (strain DSM 44449 / CECT 9708 / BC 501) TaxID=2732864 RepID=UPI001C97F210|nr:hypothetical protein [Modestobacter italicus]
MAQSTPGRPRTRLTALLADHAYLFKAIRAHLRSRAIVAIVPEPREQQGHRARRGSKGGRPVSYYREL